MSRIVRSFLAVLAVGLCGGAVAQTVKPDRSSDGLWRNVAEGAIAPRQQRQIVPDLYRTVSLDRAGMAARLATAPLESAQDVRASSLILSLPLPGGEFGRFRVVESPIMQVGLQKKFPEIRTYLGQGVDDPSATVRFDLTPEGFHAQILSGEGTLYVDPYQGGDVEHYIAYAKEDYRRADGAAPLQCLTQADPKPKQSLVPTGARPAISSGTQLRTFRLALAATGEYTVLHSGTVSGALSGMVSTMNRVDGIYEHDLAIRMVLIDDTDKVIFTNAATDPYTNNDGDTMLGQNQVTMTNLIGAANYDIGHVFSTGGGGVALRGSVCQSSSKAGGVTGSTAPDADGYDVDYVAHEMGHQFGGDHTFNSATSSCGGGNRSGGDAYETGSGVTIMAYAGICGTASVNENLQPHSEDYFHRDSLDEILAYVSTISACGTTASTNNGVPSVSAPAAFTIPKQTPFLLTAAGSDPDNDALTYVWEEFDLGTQTNSGTLTDVGNNPLFRPVDPTPSPSRFFPSLRYILDNANVVPAKVALPGSATLYYAGELLPATNRTMQFRVTARDNRANGGATNEASTAITVTAAAGPFAITAPNTAVSWAAGSTQSVTWNVASTDLAPVSAANVRLTLSLDGGYTWPVELAASVPNNGSASVNLPANLAATAQARVRVEAIGNVFFDVSDVNFAITAGGGQTAPAISVTGSVSTTQGQPAVTGNVASVSDGQDSAGSLAVSVSGAPQELAVSVTNTNGTIALTATADCTLVSPTTGTKAYPVLLTVTDSAGGIASAMVNVLVGANKRPTLGAYADQSLSRSASANIATAAAPADANNNFVGMSVTPATLPGGGAISIAPNGTVTVNTTATTNFGTHKVRAIATDTCGGAAVQQFLVQVKSDTPVLSFNNATVSGGNNLIEPNECNAATVTLSNSVNSAASATGVAGALTTTTPGVTITPLSSAYPDIAPAASAGNTTAYQISTASTVACFTDIAFTQTVSYAEGGSPATFNFSLPVGRPAASSYVFDVSTGATITTTGTLVSGSQADDVAVQINVPFAISAYATTIPAGSPITVNSNGTVQFAASGTDDWANGPLPTAASADASGDFPASAPTIFVYWSDLKTTGTGKGIFTETTGSTPNRIFKIEWRATPVSATTALDFAIYFHEGSNLFEMVYRNANVANGNGSIATIGVQAATTGSVYTQYSWGTASVGVGTMLSGTLPPAQCAQGAGICSIVSDVIFANGFEQPIP